MKDLPTIFIFDFDRTIIGDTSIVTSYADFTKFIKYACKSKEIKGDICAKHIPSVSKMVTADMIRPGFKELLAGIKKNFSTAELFLYSAGTREYVNTYVPIVEEQIGQGPIFNRPLFSRTECFIDENNKMSKSISSQLHAIVNVLKSRYKGLQKKDIDIMKLLKDRILFIDDNDVVWDMANKSIKCPAFNYTQICYLDENLLRIIYNEPIIQKFILNDKWLYLYADSEKDVSGSFDEFKMKFHLFMAHTYQMFLAENKKSIQDTFFNKLEKSIRPYANQQRPFTDEHIKTIQKMVDNE